MNLPKTLSCQIVLAAVCVLTLVAGISIGSQLSFFVTEPTPIANGIVFDEPQAIGGFQLVDQNQGRFSVENFRGAWSFVYFGFTRCSEPCPKTLAELQHLSDKLSGHSPNDDVPVKFVFVSVDPERDTLPQLKTFLQNLSPGLVGLTGDPDELRILAAQIAAPFKVNRDDSSELTIDHSYSIFLINPDAEFQAILTPPHEASQLAADFRAITDWRRGSY